jgi:hypothetical protein
MVRGQCVADQQSGVDADHGELPVAERVHEPDEVVGEGARVVALLRLVGESDAALVDRDDLEVPGERGHDEAPVVPRPGPAVDQQQRRAVAADDCVQAQVTGVDVPAGERVGEPVREARRPGDGPGPLGSRRVHEGPLSQVVLPSELLASAPRTKKLDASRTVRWHVRRPHGDQVAMVWTALLPIHAER